MFVFPFQVVLSILTVQFAPAGYRVVEVEDPTTPVVLTPTTPVVLTPPTAEPLPQTMEGLDGLDNDECPGLAVQVTATILLDGRLVH